MKTTDPSSENISWTPPPPRSGLAGSWDRFVGPGATAAENGLIAGFALAVTALVLWLAPAWTGWQQLVAGLLALDLAGGVAANAATPAKRWYHRAGQGASAHFGFVAVHLHPFVVAWLFGGWLWGAAVYGYLLAAALLVIIAPRRLERPLALSLAAGGILLGLLVWPAPAGMAWFAPLFYLKLLVAHLVREAPFV